HRKSSLPRHQRRFGAGLRHVLDREGHTQKSAPLHAASIRPVCLFEFSGSSDTLGGSAACFGSRETKFQLATCLRRDTSKDLRLIERAAQIRECLNFLRYFWLADQKMVTANSTYRL